MKRRKLLRAFLALPIFGAVAKLPERQTNGHRIVQDGKWKELDPAHPYSGRIVYEDGIWKTMKLRTNQEEECIRGLVSVPLTPV